jgi:hypothetical protein
MKDNQQGNAGQQNEEGHQKMAVRHNTFGGFQEAHAGLSFLDSLLVSGYVGEGYRFGGTGVNLSGTRGRA